MLESAVLRIFLDIDILVSRIAMVKESKARAVEDLLLNMARSGQLREKVGEKQLIELLETISSQSVAEPKIKVFIFS